MNTDIGGIVTVFLLAARGTRLDCTAFTPRRGRSALFAYFRGGRDANEVQGLSRRRRRSGGGHVERGDGEISLRAGLQVS